MLIPHSPEELFCLKYFVSLRSPRVTPQHHITFFFCFHQYCVSASQSSTGFQNYYLGSYVTLSCSISKLCSFFKRRIIAGPYCSSTGCRCLVIQDGLSVYVTRHVWSQVGSRRLFVIDLYQKGAIGRRKAIQDTEGRSYVQVNFRTLKTRM